MDIQTLNKKLIFLNENIVGSNSFATVIQIKNSDMLYRIYKLDKNNTVNQLSKTFRHFLLLTHFLITYDEDGKLGIYVKDKNIDLVSRYSWPEIRTESGVVLPEKMVRSTNASHLKVKTTVYLGKVLLVANNKSAILINHRGQSKRIEFDNQRAQGLVVTTTGSIHYNGMNDEHSIYLNYLTVSQKVGWVDKNLNYYIDEDAIVGYFERWHRK